MINYHPVHPQILDILIQTKINPNIYIKNDKLPSCTSSNPINPDSDKNKK
jgi:hypothetical protein